MNPNAYYLCLIKEDRAFFTPLAPTDVRGDDFNDAPYWCNAGVPSNTPYVEIVFDGSFCLPGEDDNKYYSVDEINARVRPWLYSPLTEKKLYAGATITRFVNFIYQHDGFIYVQAMSIDAALNALIAQFE